MEKRKTITIKGVSVELWNRYREAAFHIGLKHYELLEDIFTSYMETHPEMAEKARLIVERKEKAPQPPKQEEKPYYELMYLHRRIMQSRINEEGKEYLRMELLRIPKKILKKRPLNPEEIRMIKEMQEFYGVEDFLEVLK